ncbi:hypothetical protein [Mucilaginibacter sp.]|uniref:hypothetical protein n=1 Tax=Mucilaginibacter sp. TaxID=1882438 RepID=UPI0035BC524A
MKKIKAFLQTLITKIGAYFSTLPAELRKAVVVAVVVTENLKRFVDSPIADIVTALIPGNADDKVKDLLRAYLPVIVVELGLVKNCSEASSTEEILKCAAQFIQGLPDGQQRTKALQNLSGAITELVADGKFDWADGVYLAKWFYTSNLKNQIEFSNTDTGAQR